MSYKVYYSDKFVKDIHKLNRADAMRILNFLKKHVHGHSTFRTNGRCNAVGEEHFWNYNIGKYKVIVDIQKNLIIALTIITRKSAFNSFT